MDIDAILNTLNAEGVEYILIGGVNFLLRHAPELTFDVDVWVKDEDENLARLNRALRRMHAEWGRTEPEWAPVPEDHAWLRWQALFCLTTAQGALDVFREVRGLEGKYEDCKPRAVRGATATGAAYLGLSDADMLKCQQALDPSERKLKRIEILERALERARKAE